MLTAAFWTSALERAAKTFAQALLSLWLVGDVMFNLFTVNWGNAAGVGLGAAVVSLLTSVVSAPVGDKASPSLTKAPTQD